MATIPMLNLDSDSDGKNETPFTHSKSRTPKISLLFGETDEIRQGSSVAAAHIAIRLGFIRKVLGILSIQLLATVVVGAGFLFTPGGRGLVQQWSWMVVVGLIASIVLLVCMMVKRHETPTNYILLSLWTLCQAYTVGVVATFYDLDLVIEAVLLTALVVIGLTIYTLQTKRDFTAWGAGLFAVLWVLIFGGIIQMFLMSEPMEFFLSVGGAMLFSLFLIVDLQMMMYKLSPEEYVLAAVNLYLDVINLFLHILRILAASRRN